MDTRLIFVALLAVAGAVLAFVLLSQTPAPTQLAKEGPSFMNKDFFVVTYAQGPAWVQGKSLGEQIGIKEHLEYWRKFFYEKRLIMGGPFTDNGGLVGMIVMAVSNEREARELIDNDPVIINKVFQVAELHPWHIVLG